MIISRNFTTIHREKVFPLFKERFGYQNFHSLPRVIKVVANVGLSKAKFSPQYLEEVKKNLQNITGQTPQVRRARKAISGFKISRGEIVGLKVTLRKHRMEDFLLKIGRVILPRMRDFRGLKKSLFDKRGNFSIGIKEITIFPEIDYDKVVHPHGLEITVVTSAPNDEQAYVLLKTILGLP